MRREWLFVATARTRSVWTRSLPRCARPGWICPPVTRKPRGADWRSTFPSVDRDWSVGRQQAPILLLHHVVAFAGYRLEPCPVEHLDSGTMILHQSLLMKLVDGDRDAFPAHAGRIAYRVVGDEERVGQRAVTGMQQPANEALLDAVAPQAHGVLGDQRQQ